TVFKTVAFVRSATLPSGAYREIGRGEPRPERRCSSWMEARPGFRIGSQRNVMNVISYRPDPAEFAWTFGGVPPVLKVAPGDVLELWTEDAFGGKVRGPQDHVSKVIEFPFVNPQTGPFYV